MRKRTKYTSEFKEEAVKIGLSSNEPYSVTADNLGIGRKTFYNWINNSMSEKTHLPKSTKQNSIKYQELERECNKLKKQLKRAQMERDILKKAAAYFASQDL